MEKFIIRGGMLADGTGAPLRRCDVAVEGGRVAEVAADMPAGGRVIDAAGLVVAPGFIDIHGHSDMTLFRYPGMESKALQGVATEVTGNCGLSLFPVLPGGEEEVGAYLALHDFALPEEGISWHDLAGYVARGEKKAPAINLAPLAGHAPLRLAAMGMENRPPTAGELKAMQRLLEQALLQGAWGVSSGLIYPPGSYADTEEIAALAAVAARFDALYASHIRGEGETLLAALEEAAAIGQQSGVRVQVSHLKAMGRENRGRAAEILGKLEAARAEGVDIAADQYPYIASATTLSAVIPAWAHEGGAGALLQRLQQPKIRTRLTAEIDRLIDTREGGERIVATNLSTPRNRPLNGNSLAAIAAGLGCTPAEVVLRLVTEERGKAAAIFFSMAEEDVEEILRHPLVAVGSDGHAMNAAEASGEATHPRSYGTFPQVLGEYVRERRILPLEEAIRKMTSLPAARLGLAGRGLVQPGFAADLVLFDPRKIGSPATYADPHRYAAGIIHLFVNGEQVVREGKLTGMRPGWMLLKKSP